MCIFLLQTYTQWSTKYLFLDVSRIPRSNNFKIGLVTFLLILFSFNVPYFRKYFHNPPNYWIHKYSSLFSHLLTPYFSKVGSVLPQNICSSRYIYLELILSLHFHQHPSIISCMICSKYFLKSQSAFYPF